MVNKFDHFNVLGIVGSPRRNGNTEVMVDKILEGAGNAGAKTEKIHLSDMNISPCVGCDGCVKNGECVFQDDMNVMIEKMNQAQIWVLGTPVYWGGPSAQFKTFLDRWHGPFNIKNLTFEGKTAILAVPMESNDLASAQYIEGMMKLSLGWLKVELLPTVLATGVKNKGAIKEHTDILEKAYQAGFNMIQN